MKNVLMTALVFLLVGVFTISLSACGKFEAAIYDITGIEEEEYGFAVKTSVNADLLSAINTVITGLKANNKMNALAEYYTKVSAGNTPTICPVNIPDVSEKLNPIKVGTNTDFGIFEFIIGSNNNDNVSGAVKVSVGTNNNKYITGLDIAIMILAADSLDRGISIHDIKFEELDSNLIDGTIDAIAAAYSITDTREEFADFSQSYYFASQVIVCSKKSRLDTLAKLNGKKIGVQSSTTGQDLVEDLIKDGTLARCDGKVQEYGRAVNAYAELKKGKIKALIIDDTMAHFLVERY